MKKVKITVMKTACYTDLMENKKSAMISCNDGFRPVSFLLEATDIEAEK